MDDVRASSGNPWLCGRAHGVLPSPPVTGRDVILTLSRLLHDWPDPTPLRLRTPSERRARVAAAVAGYPQVGVGSLPFDQPIHPLSTAAIEMTLALDAWPSLAGRHSLRSELLWLDRMSRGHVALDADMPAVADSASWLRLMLAWLLAGLATREGRSADVAIILMDILYDPQDRAGEAGPIRGTAEQLSRAASRLAAGEPMRRGFARRGSHPDEAMAEWLWWARLARPLLLDDAVHHPAPECDVDSRFGTVEIRFHRIQTWMANPPGEDRGALDAPQRRLESLHGPMVRGASDLLEAVVSVIRSVILDRFGPGSFLIDGGARCSARCRLGEEERKSLERDIWNAVDGMLCPDGALGRRFAGILSVLERQGHLRAFDAAQEDVARAERRHLAWSTIPALSVSFAGGTNDPATMIMPIRRRCTLVQAAHRPQSIAASRDRREDIAMSIAARLRVEIGVQSPRDRLLSLRLRSGASDASQLPSAFRQFQQLLVVDLNRIGPLFLRPRDDLPDPEAVARRSLRFTAHWLLAVARTVRELDDAVLPEILVLGGDDLIVGTREPGGDLLAFAERLHRNLQRLNDELPACDGVSFSAGLARERGSGISNRAFLAHAVRLERAAKSKWKASLAAEPGDSRATQTDVRQWGDGTRRSLVLMGRPHIEGAMQDGGELRSDRAAVLTSGAVSLADLGPFAQITATAAALLDDLPAHARSGSQHLEAVVHETAGDGLVTVAIEASDRQSKEPFLHAMPQCEPCGNVRDEGAR